jgi:hypothetical protein
MFIVYTYTQRRMYLQSWGDQRSGLGQKMVGFIHLRSVLAWVLTQAHLLAVCTLGDELLLFLPL